MELLLADNGVGFNYSMCFFRGAEGVDHDGSGSDKKIPRCFTNLVQIIEKADIRKRKTFRRRTAHRKTHFCNFVKN